MPNVSFIQADIERLIRAAKKQGAEIEFDMRSFKARIIPDAQGRNGVDETVILGSNPSAGNFAPDGKENWDED